MSLKGKNEHISLLDLAKHTQSVYNTIAYHNNNIDVLKFCAKIPSGRPWFWKRKFRSQVVDDVINDMHYRMRDKELATLFSNCWVNTLGEFSLVKYSITIDTNIVFNRFGYRVERFFARSPANFCSAWRFKVSRFSLLKCYSTVLSNLPYN